VEPLPDMIARVLPAVCKVEGVLRGVRVSSGSGFVVSSDGLVVTNHHVIAGAVAAGCHELRVSFDDGRVFRMTPLSADAEADIAVGRLAAPAGTEFPALKLGDAGAMRAGDALVVLGAPLGGSLAPSVGALCGSRYVGDDEALSAVLPSRPDWHLLQASGGGAARRGAQLFHHSHLPLSPRPPLRIAPRLCRWMRPCRLAAAAGQWSTRAAKSWAFPSWCGRAPCSKSAPSPTP
jgi:hypothetical protein